jgi:uncharacterized protein YndB with AHSA1/START domain
MSTKPNSRIMGRLRRLNDVSGAVRMEDVYATDADDLWSALTEPDRLARWIATVEGDLRLGACVQVWFTSNSGGQARIDICDPPRRLLVTLGPGTPEETEIEALLTPAGDQTRLVIEQRGIPLEELAAHGAGWQAHVEDLGAYLAGREPAVWQPRWSALTPAYEQLGSDL